MDYQHLTDLELIKYASIDAPIGSLTALLVERFEDNYQSVAEIEKRWNEDEGLQGKTHMREVEALDREIDEKDARINDLEKENDALADRLLEIGLRPS